MNRVIWTQQFNIGNTKSLVDPGARDAPGPIFFIFMQFFFAKKLRNNKLVHHNWDLVPPLGNPGSATENISFCFLSDTEQETSRILSFKLPRCLCRIGRLSCLNTCFFLFTVTLGIYPIVMWKFFLLILPELAIFKVWARSTYFASQQWSELLSKIIMENYLVLSRSYILD